MRRSLFDLARATDAVYRSRLTGLHRLASDEAVLRQKLADLDAMRHVELSRVDMRALGADLLWQGWVMRQKTELNMQLAKLLIQKEAMRRELQKSFGRAHVAESLLRDFQTSDRKNKAKEK